MAKEEAFDDLETKIRGCTLSNVWGVPNEFGVRWYCTVKALPSEEEDDNSEYSGDDEDGAATDGTIVVGQEYEVNRLTL